MVSFEVVGLNSHAGILYASWVIKIEFVVQKWKTSEIDLGQTSQPAYHSQPEQEKQIYAEPTSAETQIPRAPGSKSYDINYIINLEFIIY